MAKTRMARIGASIVVLGALVAPSGALAAGHGGDRDGDHGGGFGQGRHHGSGGPARIATRAVDGTLEAVGGTAAPTTLTVKSAGGIVVTIAVSDTTRIDRRYDGASSLDELAVGDRLVARGRFESGGTGVFDAAEIRDVSIQKAYTRVVGVVDTASDTGLTLAVRRHMQHGPYRRGDDLTVTFASGVVVTTGTVTTTVSAIAPGQRVLALGIYDRASKALQASRLRILGNPRSEATEGTPTPMPTETAVPDATDTPTPTETDTSSS